MKTCETCNDSTTSGMSYSYNFPKIYNGTQTNSINCYIDYKNYGACSSAAIIPPTPTSMRPSIFQCNAPHSYTPIIPNTPMQDHCRFKGNNHYNNGGTLGPYFSDGANSNTQETYRKISMPNEALACGGLGNKYIVNHSGSGFFNDVGSYFK